MSSSLRFLGNRERYDYNCSMIIIIITISLPLVVLVGLYLILRSRRLKPPTNKEKNLVSEANSENSYGAPHYSAAHDISNHYNSDSENRGEAQPEIALEVTGNSYKEDGNQKKREEHLKKAQARLEKEQTGNKLEEANFDSEKEKREEAFARFEKKELSYPKRNDYDDWADFFEATIEFYKSEGNQEKYEEHQTKLKEAKERPVYPRFKDCEGWVEFFEKSSNFYKKVGDQKKYEEHQKKLAEARAREKQMGKIVQIGQVKEATNFDAGDKNKMRNAACVIASKEVKMDGKQFTTSKDKPLITIVNGNSENSFTNRGVNDAEIGSFVEVEGEITDFKESNGNKIAQVTPNSITRVKGRGEIKAPKLNLLSSKSKTSKQKQELKNLRGEKRTNSETQTEKNSDISIQDAKRTEDTKTTDSKNKSSVQKRTEKGSKENRRDGRGLSR